MIKLFFITVLVVTTRMPADGWLQWTRSFNDHKTCIQSVGTTYEQISLSVRGHLGREFIKIKEMRCLTYQEAVELNVELGH